MMEEEVGLMSRYLRSVFTDQDGVYVDVMMISLYLDRDTRTSADSGQIEFSDD